MAAGAVEESLSRDGLFPVSLEQAMRLKGRDRVTYSSYPASALKHYGTMLTVTWDLFVLPTQ
jgi:hypothetical protein